ncbi:MAG: FkbM family methyltransferase [Hyphomicrobium sp.]
MTSQPTTNDFATLLGVDVDIKVVDIGANPIDGTPPYAGMLEAGRARVLGFEPNPSALLKLQSFKSSRETYLPYAVGDGGRHTLHICAAPGMTSLLEPNPDVLNLLHGFPSWGQVLAKEEVDTVRLADVEEAHDVDFIKIDIQGAELSVFKNAGACLDGVSVIHTEVEFLQLYKNQPLFGDVQCYLHERGFSFHQFNPLVKRMIQPLTIGGDIYGGLSQCVWADAIFIRDLTRLDRCSDRMLTSMAAILHDCYQSIDVVMHILAALDTRRGTRLAETYINRVRNAAMTQLAA